MSPEDVSNRIEVKALIDAYAHCADHKKPVEYAALYAEDAIIEIFQGDPEGAQPIAVLSGRAEILKGFHDHLMPYDLTQHFIGQSILALGEEEGTGETYTLAHNILTANGQRTMTVIGVRYEDVFTPPHWPVAVPETATGPAVERDEADLARSTPPPQTPSHIKSRGSHAHWNEGRTVH